MSLTITSDYMSTVAYALNSVQSSSTSSGVSSETPSSTGSLHVDTVKISSAGKAAASGGATQTSSTSNTQTDIQKIEKQIAKTQEDIAVLVEKDNDHSQQLIDNKTTQLDAYQAELMVLSS